MRRTVALLLAVLAAAAAGCSPRQYFAQPANVEETRDLVRSLKEEQAALAKRIDAIEKELAAQNERLAGNKADLNTQMEALTENLERISDRLGDLTGRIERRPRQAPAPSLYMPPVDAPTEPARSDSGASSEAQVPNAPDPEQVYDAAYRDVTRGSYDLAVSGFNEFLRLFPDHALADNAQYWLGECDYVQNRLDEAAAEFQKVIDRYPDGDKVGAAYLKLGYCALRSNQKDKARDYFNELIRKYPTSEEARAARGKLATLN